MKISDDYGDEIEICDCVHTPEPHKYFITVYDLKDKECANVSLTKEQLRKIRNHLTMLLEQ